MLSRDSLSADPVAYAFTGSFRAMGTLNIAFDMLFFLAKVTNVQVLTN
jgi:hypothetical protein